MCNQSMDGRMHKAGVLEDERAEGQAKSGAGGLVLADLLPGSSIGSHSGCRSALCGKAGEVSSCHGDVKGHVLVVKQAVDKEVRLAADSTDGDGVAGPHAVT